MTDRLKIGQEVLIHGYVDEIRKDTIIIQNEGGYFGTVEYEVTDIKMPNTNEVLDKIRNDIYNLDRYYIYDKAGYVTDERVSYYDVINVIDKYTKGRH